MGLPAFPASHSILRKGLALFTLAFVLLALTGFPASEERVAVALFPFIALEGSPTPLERTLYDLVAARIGSMTTARQVDPEGLARFAAESGVSLERAFPAEKAAAIAALAGAEVVVLGRTRRVEEELVVVARIFGVGGSGNEEVLVSGSSVGRLAALLSEFADGITGTLGSNPERFAGGGTGPSDIVSAFQERIAGLDRPTVFLQVRESYDGNLRPESVTEAELMKFVEAAGLERSSVKGNAEVVIFAHAVGSPGTRSGALLSSDVEVELRAVSPFRGELLAVAATGHRAADIFASLAGTRAFSEATASVAPEFIYTMVKAWSSAAGRPP
jgi:hypothetical protein